VADKENVEVYRLIFPGQIIELDCSGLYLQVGLKLRERSGWDVVEPSFGGVVVSPTDPTIQPVPEHLPTYTTGRVSVVLENEFTAIFNRMPTEVWDLLSPELELHFFILDSSGLFSINTQLTAKEPQLNLLRILRPRKGTQMNGRRFIRVSVHGKAIFLLEEIREGENEGTLVDIGGGGLRIQTNAGWLTPGDEVQTRIIAGFLDERENRHVSLDITTNSRVVWKREIKTSSGKPSYEIGLAFTDIAIADQDAMINFILAYLAHAKGKPEGT